MINKRKLHGIRSFMTGFLLILAPVAMSQTAATPGNGYDPAASDERMLLAQSNNKSRRRLRRDYHDAEEDFYRLFNTLNSSDDFDVTCESKTPLGGRRKERACKAAFLWKYEAEIAAQYNDQMDGVGSASTPNSAQVEQKQNELRQQMATAIAENPELNQAFAKLAAAKRDYEAKR